jgi:hypothetical protein
MTFPLGRDRKSLFEMAKIVQAQLIQVKDYADGMVVLMANAISVNQLVDYLQVILATIALLEQAQAIEGLPAFAITMFYNPDVDFVAEGNAVLTCLQAVKSAIIQALPLDASNYLLKDQLDSLTGDITVRTLAPDSLNEVLSATIALSDSME